VAFVAGPRVVTVWPVVATLGIGLLTTEWSAGRWCLLAQRLGLSLSLKKPPWPTTTVRRC
jgi:hypothetical protein